MKKSFYYILSIFITFAGLQLSAQSKTDQEYIAKFAKTAVEEMHIYKIPASITLAQGLLETADGQSELAQNANNHFGIKCKKEWTGQTYRYTDDAYMECFRKYDSPWESYRDHSKFLAERPYYKALFNLPMTDYKAWAYGLKKAGYATNPRYAPLLIAKIEKYNLNQFDHITPEEVAQKLVQLYPELQYTESITAVAVTTEPKVDAVKPVMKPQKVKNPKVEKAPENTEKPNTNTETILKEPKSVVHPLERINVHKNSNLPYVQINEGETLYQISKLYDTSVKKLQTYNDIDKPEQINVGTYIFLKKKKGKGRTKLYVAKNGDTLHSISQKEAIQLSKLLKRNNLDKNYKVKEGDVLYLKGKKK